MQIGDEVEVFFIIFENSSNPSSISCIRLSVNTAKKLSKIIKLNSYILSETALHFYDNLDPFFSRQKEAKFLIRCGDLSIIQIDQSIEIDTHNHRCSWIYRFIDFIVFIKDRVLLTAKYRFFCSLRTADAFPVVVSLPPRNSVCEPERQNDFRDVNLMLAHQIKG